MERLTYDFPANGQHCWQVKGADNALCKDVCEDQGDNGCKNCPIAKAFDRLAAYEDTGLEPEEVEACKVALMGKSLAEIKEIEGISVERMKVLAKAEAEGRLLVLPCKTVFEPTWDAGKDCDLVCPVLIGGEECCGLCEKAELFVYERPCKQDDIDRLGKSVFRTREEAEEALKGAEE